ncbi:hypothetical protein Y88_0886 [Novosphingobium nitrogenifigens DSM 19370]|uniref:Uncharacterized protein n=1 Tax=Novosphingobium nitrogenifigens DSM 19370 TaxID=983920 RepID=F1Z914_9SPHN|nr:hypothetical protein Y88_0886 [Novosphingobium nitrogenifigens DSM 19370]
MRGIILQGPAGSYALSAVFLSAIRCSPLQVAQFMARA